MLKQWCNEELRHHDRCSRDTGSIEAIRMINFHIGIHGYTIRDTTGVESIVSCRFFSTCLVKVSDVVGGSAKTIWRI